MVFNVVCESSARSHVDTCLQMNPYCTPRDRIPELEHWKHIIHMRQGQLATNMQTKSIQRPQRKLGTFSSE